MVNRGFHFAGRILTHYYMKQEKFYFIRHAETVWNQKTLCQGQRDIPLSQKGYKDAQHLSERLRAFPIECIISSPLCRALDTAKKIQSGHKNAKFYIVDALSERFWGDLEGMSSQEMYSIEKFEEKDPHYIVGKKVEKRHDFRNRIRQGIGIAQSYHPHPFIVSHGRVFVEICLIFHMPPLRQISNCQLIEISKHYTQWCYKSIL